MDKTEVAVSLRGLHLFTHPALIYGVLNRRKPGTFLRRNLNYAVRPSRASSKPGEAAIGSGATPRRELHVRLGGLSLAGSALPSTATLFVVLCEAASTGRDFKPVRAAAVSLPARHREGTSAEPGLLPEDRPGDLDEDQTAPPVVLALPPRRLTHPVLMVAVSDWQPDMRAFTPRGSRARSLSTDLRSQAKLLGLLPDPAPVWAALYPLDSVLPSNGVTVGGATAGPSGPSATTAAAALGSAAVPQPLALQRGQLTRSSCSVTTAAGRTLVTTLLHLQALPGVGPGGMPLDEAGAEVAGGGGGGGGGFAATAAAAGSGEEWQVLSCSSGYETRLTAVGLSYAAEVTTTVPGSAPETAESGGQTAVAPGALRRRTPKHAVPVASGSGAAASASDASKDAVVEFRYVFDDPAWMTDPSTQPGQQTQKPRGRPRRRADNAAIEPPGAAVAGGCGSAGSRGGTGGSGSGEDGADPMEVDALDAATGQAGGSGCGGQDEAPKAAEHREAERAAWMSQQMSRARGTEPQEDAENGDEPAAAASAEVPAVTERYFVEEVRVQAGAAFTCPLCPVPCRGFKGLQLHLPATHGLYRYTFSEEPPRPADAVRTPGGAEDPEAALGGSGRLEEEGEEERRLQLQAGDAGPSCRYVIEVRLRPEAVDPVRRDLVPPPDRDLLDRKRREAGLAPVVLGPRPWAFVRAAGMETWSYLTEQGGQGDAAHGTVTPGKGATATRDAGRRGSGSAAAVAAGSRQPQQVAPGRGATQRLRRTGSGGGGGGGVAGDAGAAPGAGEGGRGAFLGQQTKRMKRRQGEAAQGAGAAGGGVGGESGSRAAAAPVRVPLKALKQTIAAGSSGPTPEPQDAAAAGASGSSSRVGVAPGSHPPGRRYFHSRSGVPGTVEELFGPYDSEDETDDEEWEASFDRHVAYTTRLTILPPEDRRFFKLWNTFTRRRPIYADYITPLRCLQFAREHGPQLRSDPELRGALTHHMLLLYEFNLIDPRTMTRVALIADGRLTCTEEEDVRFLNSRNPSGRAAAGTATGTAAAAAAAAARGSGGGGDTGASGGCNGSSGGGSGDGEGSSGSGADGGDGSGGSGSESGDEAAEEGDGGTREQRQRTARGGAGGGGGGAGGAQPLASERGHRAAACGSGFDRMAVPEGVRTGSALAAGVARERRGVEGPIAAPAMAEAGEGPDGPGTVSPVDQGPADSAAAAARPGAPGPVAIPPGAEVPQSSGEGDGGVAAVETGAVEAEGAASAFRRGSGPPEAEAKGAAGCEGGLREGQPLGGGESRRHHPLGGPGPREPSAPGEEEWQQHKHHGTLAAEGQRRGPEGQEAKPGAKPATPLLNWSRGKGTSRLQPQLATRPLGGGLHGGRAQLAAVAAKAVRLQPSGGQQEQPPQQ